MIIVTVLVMRNTGLEPLRPMTAKTMETTANTTWAAEILPVC